MLLMFLGTYPSPSSPSTSPPPSMNEELQALSEGHWDAFFPNFGGKDRRTYHSRI